MADQNARLLVFLKKLEDQPGGWRLIHIHVSELPGSKKSRENITRAIQILHQLKGKYGDGEIFLMKNFDLVFATRGVTKPVLASAGDEVKETFLGKMAPTFTNEHGGRGEFFTIFELASEFPKAMAWAEKVAGVAKAVVDPNAEAKKQIDFQTLARIKEDLPRTNIAPMLFNQPIYFIGDAGKTQILFQEMYVSTQQLEETLCPGVSLTSRKWLFADLTEDLDAVVMRVLSDPMERTSRKRFSINVNLSTLASDRFARFDAEIPPEQRSDVMLEISKTDFFENIFLFRKLVPFLRERGYRILLDGLAFESALAVDFDGIECDFAKVFWSSEAPNFSDEMVQRLRNKFARTKPRFVLARCDTAESVRFARMTGIKLVQGRLVDHMVKKNIPL